MSTAASAPSRATETVSALARFFSSYRFPTTALFVIVLYNLALLVSIAIPASSGPLGQFAEEMRVWCFGYDPATGSYQWTYVLMVTVEPIVMGGLLVTVWYQPLKQAVTKTPRAMLPYAGVALLLVSTAAASLFGMRRQPGSSEPAFPAAELRTGLEPPTFRLTDHTGAEIASTELRGRVVLLTGVYASCAATCPMILGQAKRAVASLREDQRRDVTVVAVTMDPERDGVPQLAAMAAAQSVRAPLFRLVTGQPGDVAEVLDRLGVVRRKDPTTGIIDHANVLALVDRSGKLAYRFSLGDLQERWLADALRLLVSEPRVPEAT